MTGDDRGGGVYGGRALEEVQEEGFSGVKLGSGGGV
jgi:hypothetical protein